ncbi:MAG: hypothetical protein AAGA18_03635 [Verrucomicrobiota bacterium]
MEKEQAIQQIREACNEISTSLMQIHPALSGLNHEKTKDAIIKTSYELTKNVEGIKKHIAKLEQRDSQDTIT